MPLQRREQEIPLNGGLDTKQFTELQAETTLREVTNLRWDARGQLRKRPTYASSVTPSAPSGFAYSSTSTPETLFTHSGVVHAITEGPGVTYVDPTDPTISLWTKNDSLSLSETALTGGTRTKYAPRACKVARRYIERSQFGKTQTYIFQVASAIYDDHLVVAWLEHGDTSARLRMKALHKDTGAALSATYDVSLSNPSTLASCSFVNVIPYYVSGSEGALITYAFGTSAPYEIRSYLYNASTRAFSTGGTLTSNAKVPHHAVANAESGDSKFYLAYTNNTTSTMTAEYRSVAGITSTHNQSGPTSVVTHAIVVGTGKVLLVSASTTDVYAEVFGSPANWVSLLTAFSETFGAVTASLEGTNVAVVYVNRTSSGSPTSYGVNTRRTTFTSTTPTLDYSGTCPNAFLAGSAVTLDNRSFVPLAQMLAGSPYTIHLCRHNYNAPIPRLEPVARVGHDRAFDLSLLFGYRNITGSVDGSTLHFAFLGDPSEDGFLATSTTPAPQTIFQSAVTFATSGDALPLPYVEVDGVTLIASGTLLEWDGTALTEAAPLCRPSVQLDVSAAGSESGTFSLVAIYRWVDSKGRLHRSAPSEAVSTGAISAKEITAYVHKPLFYALEGLTVSQDLEPELYITESNGSTYYLANVATGTNKGKKFYDTDDDYFWTFSAVVPGQTSDPALYSTGASGEELVPEPPPAFRDIKRIGDRLWGVDAEEPTRIWYTKPLVTGYAAEWSTACTLTIGDNAVAIVALAGNPTFLCEAGIWQVYGAGPDATGSGSFSPAVRIASECSCIDPVSVCRTPIGVVFRGRRGYYAVQDSGEVAPFGLPIDPSTRVSELASYDCGRVVFDEVQNEIRVCDREDGKHFVYNLVEQKWSEWTQSTSAQNILDIAVARGRVWYLHRGASSSSIRREYGVDETDHSLGTESWSLQTPWIRLSGVAGYARVWEVVVSIVAAENIVNVSPFSIVYESRGDSGESGTDTFTWHTTDLSQLGGDGDLLDLHIRPAHQTARMIRLTISETPTVSGYAGSVPVSMRIVMGVDGKAYGRTRGSARKGAA